MNIQYQAEKNKEGAGPGFPLGMEWHCREGPTPASAPRLGGEEGSGAGLPLDTRALPGGTDPSLQSARGAAAADAAADAVVVEAERLELLRVVEVPPVKDDGLFQYSA